MKEQKGERTMSIVRWNPERELHSFPGDVLGFPRGINRMFADFLHGGLWDEESIQGGWNPAVDIAEKDDEYVVKVELPGVNKEDVKISTRDNILTIRGEKKEEKETKESSFHHVERAYGSFQRSFTLSTGVKSDKIEATFKDGILAINLPKAEEARPKMIEVKIR
jgi:HSP20 family protein